MKGEAKGDRKGLVLVIEDDPIARNILVNLLSGQGYSVLEAEDGIRGLELFREKKPDLVFLDIVLPRLSGYEICQTARREPDLSSIPILMVTSLEKKEDIIKGLKSGASDYITKPFSPTELLARSQAHLDKKLFFDQLKNRSKRFQLAYEVLETTTSSLDLKQVLYHLVERTARALAADRCSIILVESEERASADKSLRGRVVASHENPNLTEITIDLSRYPEILRSFQTGSLVQVEDVGTDPLMEEVRTTLVPLGIRSLLAVPLAFRGEILGALLLRTMRISRNFDEEEIAIARVIAGAGSNAVKNAALYQSLETKNENLERISRRLQSANEELTHLARTKSEFLSMVSHELRTPLTTIIGFSELMHEGQVGDLNEQQREFCHQILVKGRALLSLINDLLDTGRIDAGKLSARMRKVEIREIIAGAVAASRYTTPVPRDFVVEVEEGLSPLEADPDMIRQVLVNLLGNAVKFSPPHAPILVSAQRMTGRRESDLGDLLKVSVSDKGMGIDQEYHQMIFNQFFQVEQGTARTHQGSGLGLYIARAMVELHKGRIWVESSPGHGSTFHFTIPFQRI